MARIRRRDRRATLKLRVSIEKVLVMTNRSLPPTERVDAVILTVIPPELRAARQALAVSGRDRIQDASGTLYDRGKIFSERRNRNYAFALGCIGSAGNPSAAAATTAAIHRWRPQAVLLMGIAAGYRGKVKIGNVVFSERIVAYEPAALKVAEDGSPIEEPRPEIERWTHAIAQDVQSYIADGGSDRWSERFKQLGGSFPEPPPEERDSVARTIRADISTIASGEKLLCNPDKLKFVRERTHGKTEAGEMEAVGFVEACRRERVDWLAIRGISDFGDSFKSDEFHKFASLAAAIVLADFLRYGLHLTDVAGTRETENQQNLNGRGKAIALLKRLLPAQFEEVVFRYAGDGGAYLPTKAPQAERAIELVRYASQREEESLTGLLETIYDVAPALRRSK